MKPLSPSDKKNIYDMLATAYLDLIRQGLIGKFERRFISHKVLDRVEKAKTFHDLSVFVKDLLKFYPVFRFASVQIDSEIGKMHEADVISRLQTFIKSS